MHRPNGDTADSQSCITVSPSTGLPWVVWGRNYTDTGLVYSLWVQEHWLPERGVTVNLPGVTDRCRPSVCSNDQGRICCVWHNLSENRDIGSSFWVDTCWSQEMQVNSPDSIGDHDYAPKVACGGGQVWCVWYGGRQSLYSVFASRWNEELGQWEPEMQVSPPDGRLHWWCDVAVDSAGTPHVVWCTHPLYTVFYSYYTGDSWTSPIPVNDTTRVTASPWADPHIVIDRTGMMHLSFTGAYRGASYRDIFYTRNDGTGWDTCQLVTRDVVYDEWISDIAADRPDNVWVIWDRQGEGLDQFRVYASHYDGIEWPSEERLDGDSASNDYTPNVVLDQDGCPWVVWAGISYSAGHFDIFFNRYLTTGVNELSAESGLGTGMINAFYKSAGEVLITYELSIPSGVSLKIYNQAGMHIATIDAGYKPAGRHIARWDGYVKDGTLARSGVYFCHLKGNKLKSVCKFIWLAR